MNVSIRLRVPALVATAMIALVSPATARADEIPFPLLNEWWQWALSFPAAVNPVLDNTGKQCSLGQHGNLWFLAGNTGGTSVRECTVPRGTRVMIPVHNAFCFPDARTTQAQCFDAVATDFAGFTVADAWFDGQSVRAGQVANADFVEQFPVTGESIFNFVVPRNGLFGLRAGVYRATIAAGRWAFVSLPTAGAHTLRVRARSTGGFVTDVTYRLDVVDAN
jgi:hypothetical protein